LAGVIARINHNARQSIVNWNGFRYRELARLRW